jgi:hypothetical protein
VRVCGPASTEQKGQLILQEQFGLTWRRFVPRSMMPKYREPTRGMPVSRVMRKEGISSWRSGLLAVKGAW